MRCQLTSAAATNGKLTSGVLGSANVHFGDFEVQQVERTHFEPPFGWSPFYYPEVWPMIFHGQPYRCFQKLAFQHGAGWGKLLAPADNSLTGLSNGKTWLTPSALLESCFVVCGAFQYYMTERNFAIFPQRLDAFRVHRQPKAGEECTLLFQYRELADGRDCFDFSLHGIDGSLIFAARGLETVGLHATVASEIS